jgi:putative nucleotidyltransferase with HDIG domain
MRTRLVHLYVAGMVVTALVALAITEWRPLLNLGIAGSVGLIVLLGMAIASESLAIRLNVGETASSSSITFIPLLASVQLFGPAAGVLLMALTDAFGEFVVRRKALERVGFNIAQVTVAASVGGWAFTVMGGVALQPLLSTPASADLSTQLLPFMAFALVFLAFNHVAVSLAIALSGGLHFRDVLAQMLGSSGASLQDVLVSPIAIVVAFLYVQWGVSGILIVLLPLLFVRRAYLTADELRAANTALLRALVKAIETRDPYTSGHSVRVSHLAKRIAARMGLSRAAVRDIETAALLHDIGKIEAPYTGILSKTETLSLQERVIIRSHVTKGEELLRNLSSFPESILRVVRHHHEREDGAGYPDGLKGDEIPIGARIVAVCDAVDAMLSDRPYRGALTLSAVIGQLRVHNGTQFAPGVVRVLLDDSLLTQYAELVETERNAEGSEVAFGEPPLGRPTMLAPSRFPSVPDQVRWPLRASS